MHMYTIHKSNCVYKSQWLQVYEDLIGYNDSNHLPEIFNRINVDDTVIILPIFENGVLLMVEGYRHGAGEDLLEFPGGFIDKNEEPSQAARGELFEETRYTLTNNSIIIKYCKDSQIPTGKLLDIFRLTLIWHRVFINVIMFFFQSAMSLFHSVVF